MQENSSPGIRVKWVDGLQFLAADDLGHALVLDTSFEAGGFNQGFRPGKLLMVALAGCTAMDVISILQKKQQKVSSFVVEVSGEQASDYPKRYLRMHVRYHIKGENILREAVERAIQLSEEKYCMVRATLSPQVQISSEYFLEND